MGEKESAAQATAAGDEQRPGNPPEPTEEPEVVPEKPKTPPGPIYNG
jgi:hypothetical protein